MGEHAKKFVKQLQDARIQCMADWHPITLQMGWNLSFKTPISATDRQRLFEKLDSHFQAWAGVSITEHLSGSDGQPNNLRRIRKARGLSQRDLAKMIGTGSNQICRLEIGQRQLTENWIKRLCAALECSPDELVNWDTNPNTGNDGE